jgi:hypothetical protein
MAIGSPFRGRLQILAKKVGVSAKLCGIDSYQCLHLQMLKRGDLKEYL